MESSFGEVAKLRLDAAIRSARACFARRGDMLRSYDELLLAVRTRTSMLSRRAQSTPRSLDVALAVNGALAAFALHHRDWHRLPDTWRPLDDGWRRAIASLAEHLFALYPMPRFMTSAWLEGELGKVTAAQDWYKLVGRGRSIREAAVPMPITRAMAHRLSSVPVHLTTIAGLRWAQVASRGGGDDLARAVAETRLGRTLEHEDFWTTVIDHFVRHADLDLAHVGPIVDFVHHQKLARRAPQPDFSMKGRTNASLLRLVEAWHRELGQHGGPSISWRRSRIGELYWLEKRDHDARAWTISEIVASEDLVAEGRAMRHCVATYLEPCVQRRRSIWTMRVETERGVRRVLTIEVDLGARRVLQARRKCNALPGETEREVLARWAAREGLALTEGLRASAR
ncbi:MAG: PcfJ domain-containing protein [Labilithrix sp.]|nr:PcfJ domain-containing protein [Labilithrix sp.]